MENYTKGESRTFHDPPPLSMEGALEMKVTNGSKIRNLMGFAMSSMAEKNVKHVTWNGTGNAVSKTISCAEIMKRKVKGLHQITQIGYLKVEDVWNPKIEGLDSLKVSKNIPAISILLSKELLDTNHPSYQSPNAKDIAWSGPSKDTRKRQASSKQRSDAVKGVKKAASKHRPDNRNVRNNKNNKPYKTKVKTEPVEKS